LNLQFAGFSELHNVLEFHFEKPEQSKWILQNWEKLSESRKTITNIAKRNFKYDISKYVKSMLSKWSIVTKKGI